MKRVALLFVAFLYGCPAPVDTRPPREPILVPQPVEIPVSVPCMRADQIPAEPVYEGSAADLHKKNLHDKVQALLREIEQRRTWQGEAAAVMRKCASPPG